MPPSPKTSTSARQGLLGTTHPRYADGNFEVITADNVTFRVNDYHLFANSAVFLEARRFKSDSEIAPGVRYTVQLLDEDFETAAVFEMVTPIELAATLKSVLFYQKVIRFLNKWEVVRPLSHLLLCLKMRAQSDQDGFAMAVYVIGAGTDDTQLCRDVLGSSTKSTPAFDPNNYADWVWTHCPPRYLAALVKSWATLCSKNSQIMPTFDRHFKVNKTRDTSKKC